MRLRLDYSPGDRVYYAKKLRMDAVVRSGVCTEVIANKDGTFVRVSGHGLAPSEAVYAKPEQAQTACRDYNDKLERS